MSETAHELPVRILIASANPLFAHGLEKMVSDRWKKRGAEVRLVESMQEAIKLLEEWHPGLVIVDYDDRSIQRDVFLDHFIAGVEPLQVILVSLKSSGEVMIYDRRSLTPDQAEDWLDLSGK